MQDQDPKHQPSIPSELVHEDATFEDIVQQFVEGLSRRLDTMREALESSDFDMLRIAAHQLKGSGGGYGYPLLTQKAAHLEQTATQRSFEECCAIVEELKELCARVVVHGDK